MPTAKPLDENAGPVVALLSHRPFAWFTDIDGTLSPIAERPDDAIVPARIRDLVERLGRRIDRLVIISGRAPAVARSMVNIPRATYIGNHGLGWMDHFEEQTLPAALPYVEKVAHAESRLRDVLGDGDLLFENKGPVLAVHYRTAEDPDAARRAVLDAAHEIATPLGLHIEEGRKVVELRPPLNRNKGAAVRESIRRHGIRGAVYVGDDLTDIDAFRTMRSLREQGVAHTVSVAVASDESDRRVLNEADYRVEGVDGVARLLDAVVDVLATGEIR